MFEICGWFVTRVFHESDNPPHLLPRHTPYPKWVVAFPKTPVGCVAASINYGCSQKILTLPQRTTPTEKSH
ncbi:MAG: hypothetical protein WBG66_03865 [Geitlerinemataceae cyanobacterium]